MAFSLQSERPVVAASLPGWVGHGRHWLAKAAAERQRRTTLASLLDLENFRLDDLGITREDVIAALHDQSRNAGRQLSFKRSLRAGL